MPCGPKKTTQTKRVLMKISTLVTIIVLILSGGAAYGKLWADVQTSKKTDERIEAKVDKILDLITEGRMP